MAATIDSNYINQFSPVMHMLLEQQVAKLRPAVAVERANGEKHFFDRLGSFTATEIVSRNQPVEPQDAAHSRRMATIRKYEASVLLDDLDRIKMMIDPSNPYTRKLAAALGRKFDDVVIAAALGTAATGQTGSGSAAFDSNNSIAAGGNGLTKAKIDQALRLLEAAEVDMDNERIFLVVPATGVEDILAEATFTSFDYQGGKPLAGRQLPSYRGLSIIRSQRLSSKAIIMSEDAVKVAIGQELNVTVKDRPDLTDVTQFQVTMAFGAVRMEEARVIEVNYV